MFEKELFEREQTVLEVGKALLANGAETENSWSNHYQKLLHEFERVVNQSQRLIRLGDMMQQKLNSITEELQIEIENHKKTQTEKEAFQVQLFQSQKMETMGTLAAGIAHDFNNMLTVILGFSDMLLADKNKGDHGYEELRKIVKTSEDAADL
ncbi:MAG: histidine kinase dimerization/phospho-acceptor domain-containing protein, partial [Desulfomonile sp.]